MEVKDSFRIVLARGELDYEVVFHGEDGVGSKVGVVFRVKLSCNTAIARSGNLEV